MREFVKRVATTAALGLLVGTLTGCLSVGAERPAARFGALDIDQQTGEGARVLLTVEVDNPNDFDLELTEATYKINVEGVAAFSFDGVVPDKALPPEGTQQITFPAALGAGGRPLQGRSYNVSGSLTYEPPGELRAILTESGFPLPSVPFSGSGRLE